MLIGGKKKTSRKSKNSTKYRRKSVPKRKSVRKSRKSAKKSKSKRKSRKSRKSRISKSKNSYSYNLNQIKKFKISEKIYNKYKLSDIPIEVITNLCLLLNGVRKIIQYDNYLYSNQMWKKLINFFNDPIIRKYVTIIQNKNLIVYVKNRRIDKLIEKHGTRSNEFGNLLDNNFYKCNFDKVYNYKNIIRVAINVKGPVLCTKTDKKTKKIIEPGRILKSKNYAGAILIQMCTRNDLKKYIADIYDRFRTYQKYIWDIDTKIQVTLECDVKKCYFDDQPSFKVKSVDRVK